MRSRITQDPGLSPRVRGNLASRRSGQKIARSVPACAGETFRICGGDDRTDVYPRVCGGTLLQ